MLNPDSSLSSFTHSPSQYAEKGNKRNVLLSEILSLLIVSQSKWIISSSEGGRVILSLSFLPSFPFPFPAFVPVNALSEDDRKSSSFLTEIHSFPLLFFSCLVPVSTSWQFISLFSLDVNSLSLSLLWFLWTRQNERQGEKRTHVSPLCHYLPPVSLLGM